jgi:hypothetical protein
LTGLIRGGNVKKHEGKDMKRLGLCILSFLAIQQIAMCGWLGRLNDSTSKYGTHIAAIVLIATLFKQYHSDQCHLQEMRLQGVRFTQTWRWGIFRELTVVGSATVPAGTTLGGMLQQVGTIYDLVLNQRTVNFPIKGG